MYGIAAKLLKELGSGRKVFVTVYPYKSVTSVHQSTLQKQPSCRKCCRKSRTARKQKVNVCTMFLPLLIGQPARRCLWLNKRCGWVCRTSPEMQALRKEIGLGLVILQNHRKKVLQATEERLTELAGSRCNPKSFYRGFYSSVCLNVTSILNKEKRKISEQ